MENNIYFDDDVIESKQLVETEISYDADLGYKCGETFFCSITKALRVRCITCELQFDYGNEIFLNHVIDHHYGLFVSADKLEMSSKTEAAMQNDIKTTNDEAESQSSSKRRKRAAKTRKDRTDLLQHPRNGKLLKEGVICEQCGKKFVHKTSLDSHLDIAHNPNRLLFPCNDCEKTFASANSLKAHNRHYHTKELPFVCEIKNCKKRYASLKGLKYHQGKHSNATFACPDCNKQYSHKNKLQTHYRRHHSVGKIYHCDQCEKSFYDLYFLKKHMICHTNERPFLCDQCPANFPRQKALVAHKKTHSGIRDEICKLCSQAFNLYEGLYQHMKIRHGIKFYRGMSLDEMLEKQKK